MAIKKSELYSSIWKSCDELRGGMDASQYKNYVLALLFVKYVSDKYAGQSNAVIEVPEGGSFASLVSAKGQPDIGDKINKIIAKLAEANELQGVINVADFNDDALLGTGKEKQDRLRNLIAIFENPALDFSRNRAEGDDLLGDAYEYLMRFFATESGKSKGQFYTPAEVSRVMAKLIGIQHATRSNQTIYDPTCGSGSLLLKAADEASVKITIYGQEMDKDTRALAVMNMYLHSNPTAEIWQGNTLSSPHWKDNDGSLKKHDFAVANPPFSSKAWSNGVDLEHDTFGRFNGYGVPPEKNGDYAFLLHVLASLKSTGKGAIILPHGVLFRGNAEADIRRNIVRRGYIKGIIGLPPNLFYGTGIPACIIVLDKENAAARTGIFMIDASRGFMKDGNKNRLRHQDIHKIVDVFNRQLEVPKYARMVAFSEIEANDYNLNIPRYIDGSEPEDRQDIEAHLLGGIPNYDVAAFRSYWDEFPALKGDLFEPADRDGYSRLKVEPSQIKATIIQHQEFTSYRQRVTALFERWRADNLPCLQGIEVGSHPKALIETLAESLLRTFANTPLIDAYDVYQHLMTYWSETMQDDVYLIASDGWNGAKALRLIIEDKDKKSKEPPDLVVGNLKYKADLIPLHLIIARYFATEQQALDQLQLEIDTAAGTMEALRDEHLGEDGLLQEALDDKEKLTKKSVTARLKAIKDDLEAAEELALLTEYLGLLDAEGAAKKRKSDAEAVLVNKVFAKYQVLTEEETKLLVVEDKWLATISSAVQGEIDRVSQTLTGRVRLLAERYAVPLPTLTNRVDELSAKVEAHLKKMGYSWM